MRGTAISLFAFVLVATMAIPAAAQFPGPMEDHFKVYEVPEVFSFTGQIQIVDQFGDLDLSTLELDKFATPVEKNGEPMIDPIRHQTWWTIDDPQLTRRVVLENQFGTQTWFVKDARYLVLPADKNTPGAAPAGGNHYKCYDATGPTMDIPVQLVDQFGAVDVRVMEPNLFCNPAEKVANGVVYPIEVPEAHLACYRITPPMMYGIGAMAFDQFGDWQITLEDHLWLCVPSFKIEAVPTEKMTWGGIKLQHR